MADPSGTHVVATSRPARMAPQERRKSILAAASELFAEVGYQRCRMSDVAARLGVTEPVVFQNFGSKAALYAAVLEQAADAMCTMLRSAVDEAGSVSTVLAEMLAPAHFDQMHALGSPGALFADAVALTSEPGAAAAARKGLGKVAKALAELLAAGQTTGQVRAGLDPAAAAWWLLSLMASHRFRAALMPNRQRLEAQLGAMTLEAITSIAD